MSGGIASATNAGDIRDIRDVSYGSAQTRHACAGDADRYRAASRWQKDMQAVDTHNNADGSVDGSKNIYLDTEFSSLSAPALLSIGLVADDGSECYGELAADRLPVNAFVRQKVLSQWGRMSGSAASTAQLGIRVSAWLSKLGGNSINVVYDYDADFELLQSALRAAGLWSRWSGVLRPFKVGYLARQPISNEAMDLSWTHSSRHDDIHRHHALADARALRAGYRALQKVRIVSTDDDVASCQTQSISNSPRIFL